MQLQSRLNLFDACTQRACFVEAGQHNAEFKRTSFWLTPASWKRGYSGSAGYAHGTENRFAEEKSIAPHPRNYNLMGKQPA
jgi:hypothetical protein